MKYVEEVKRTTEKKKLGRDRRDIYPSFFTNRSLTFTDILSGNRREV